MCGIHTQEKCSYEEHFADYEQVMTHFTGKLHLSIN